MSHPELSEQEILRRESLQKLRDLGIDPYPAALYAVDAFAADIKQNFEDGKQVCLAGRMLSQRIMGKASFAEIQDASGRIQVYFNRDELCPGEDKTLYNEALKAVWHRGAVDKDGKTGDGAGIHVELAKDFFEEQIKITGNHTNTQLVVFMSMMSCNFYLFFKKSFANST